ncbi:Uncharacterised protein [Vibrio cholerae]|nr:Uncharacterised protein [Vibrio cholerae]
MACAVTAMTGVSRYPLSCLIALQAVTPSMCGI